VLLHHPVRPLIELLDGDGRTDPLLVYRSFGSNRVSDGRTKFLLFYKGTKYGVRHQNGTLDGQNETRTDEGIEELPSPVREHLKGIIERLEEEEGLEIFPGFE
jgi:hypothetical protein